jgi:LmbE family N-acetylglucosaminyl deacetylase
MPIILSLLAHPDDAEILCGGTLILLADLGWEIHVCSMSPGDCGSTTLPAVEIAEIRRQEGRDGARVLGGTYHCLEERDLQMHYDRSSTSKACGLLREVRPDVVIAHSPADYMLDHEETSRVARAACFNAPIPNAPAPEGSAAPIDHIPALYYGDAVEDVDPLGRAVTPSFLVDVSDVAERKLEALAKHASQREWLRAQHDIDEYIEGTREWGRNRGRPIGVEHAEGFRQHLGHAYPHQNILAEALGEHTHIVASDTDSRRSTS